MTGTTEQQVHEFTRQELYDLVWADPITHVAERLGVTGSGLAKICRQASIPTPDRGYWAKLKVGKRMMKVRLPPREPGMPDRLRIGGGRYYYPDSLLTKLLAQDPESVPEIQPLVFSESIESLTERIRKRLPKVRVPKTMTDLYGQVARLVTEDAARKERQRTARYPSPWDSPLFDTSFERRRLRLLSGLCVALTEAGAIPHLRGKEGSEFTVGVGLSWLPIKVEQVKGGQRRGSKTEADKTKEQMRLTLPSNALAEGSDGVWQDREDAPLEEQLNEILLAIIVGGELAYRSHQHFCYKWDVERRQSAIDKVRKERAEQVRVERERIERLQAKRLQALMAEATAWRQAAEIRSYVAAVTNSHNQHDTPPEITAAWASWALSEANRIDPLQQQDLHQAWTLDPNEQDEPTATDQAPPHRSP